MFRYIFLSIGFLSLGLGLLGVALPLLPTTPFLLVSLWCFSRSSTKWRRWLLTNKLFGSYLKSYISGEGIPLRLKIFILALLWSTTLYCAIELINNIFVSVGLLLISTAVTVHLSIIKTRK